MKIKPETKSFNIKLPKKDTAPVLKLPTNSHIRAFWATIRKFNTEANSETPYKNNTEIQIVVIVNDSVRKWFATTVIVRLRHSMRTQNRDARTPRRNSHHKLPYRIDEHACTETEIEELTTNLSKLRDEDDGYES
ncbi:hypothetical protein CHS0354_023070 [Potamilus streckersoni]|uniref:Uncharacterized protein n=1 Tax=Potamilus streckersoni TaxID=2493646 RepID=A0AAE0RWE8_9BIVA|nr:hypothetical protein CHS0354_023070 [Potamilus streckersoni]